MKSALGNFCQGEFGLLVENECGVKGEQGVEAEGGGMR